MKRGFTLGAIAMALLAGAAATAADLQTAYREAKKYDATYAAAQAALRAGVEGRDQARAEWLPKVSVSAGVAQSENQQADPRTGQLKSATGANYKIGLSQPIYDVRASVGSAKLNESARLAEVQFQAAEQDLAVRVAQAYFDVLYAQDSVEFVRAQKDAVSQQLAQAKKSFEVGVATITDTHEAQARYDAITAAEIAALNDLLVKQSAFQLLTGLSADGLTPLSSRLQATPPQPNDVSAWVSEAEAKSQQIDAKRGALALATADIDLYRAARQPIVGLEAGFGDGMSRIGGHNYNSKGSGSVGINLTIPVYTGGATSSKLRETIARRDQAQSDLEATRREVVLKTRQAFLGVQSGAAQIRALEQALVSTQSSLDSTRLGKDVGVRTTLDLLNAQQQYYSTRRDLARARYDYLLNRLRLKQAVGDLAERDVELLNAELSR
ncbi:TolC family outer membrane protein [Chitinimonas lacunae]|uniref:TolC family outer membrane protein n=1 Tax=Chitinimonas lacunae TaxID=1963018 RepID=A0ABV8MPK7_9NEIS